MRVFFLRAAEDFEDRQQHAIEISEYVMVPEAENAKALAAEIGCPRPIPFRRVLSAVGFNDQSSFQTAEVGDVWPDRPLPAEFMSAQAARPKLAPQGLLGIGGVAP
ncbi:MAG: hypothetical protein QOJ94_2503 [Sphingomonadales bacterium]|nr:hypothetical protein [Sphingomonadales bacterium]